MVFLSFLIAHSRDTIQLYFNNSSVMGLDLFFYFINALQHKCWRSVGLLVLQPVKDAKWKVVQRKKFHDWTWVALNLQPSDLRSNTYRSLTGGQVFSPCYFHVSISIGTPESDSLSLSTPIYLGTFSNRW